MVSIEMKVKRDQQSWTYIYVVLGFALTIESTVVSMITPLCFPWNILVFAIIAVATWYLFRECRWFQNKLIGWKIRYESISDRPLSAASLCLAIGSDIFAAGLSALSTRERNAPATLEDHARPS